MTDDYDYESLGSNATIGQDALAGALAGIAEHCAMYPVDSIKVLKYKYTHLINTNKLINLNYRLVCK